jgi:hypothetical protein
LINFAAVFVDHLRQQHPGSTGCFDEKLLLLILNERIILFYFLTKDAFHYYSITDNVFLYSAASSPGSMQAITSKLLVPARISIHGSNGAIDF